MGYSQMINVDFVETKLDPCCLNRTPVDGPSSTPAHKMLSLAKAGYHSSLAAHVAHKLSPELLA